MIFNQYYLDCLSQASYLVADEVSGAQITYDNSAELFTVAGGASAATPANPTGRVRVVLSPRLAASAPAVADTPATGASK